MTTTYRLTTALAFLAGVAIVVAVIARCGGRS